MRAEGAPAAGEVLLDGAERERVVTGWHRSMGGEDCRPPDLFERDVETGSRVDGVMNALQHRERGMALVQMKDGGPDPERLQGADAADPEDDFLLHPGFAVAAVEAC